MPTNRIVPFLRSARGHFALAFLLTTLVVDSQTALSEPIGYVLRPDRQDIGVLDGRSHTVIGAMALGNGGDIGDLNIIEIHPGGRVGLIGATGMGLGQLDVLSGRVIESVELGGRFPIAVDTTAIAFQQDSTIAYVSARSSGLLLEVETNSGQAEILRSWEAPSYVKLFYIAPFMVSQGVLETEVGPLLVGLEEGGSVGAFDLALGQEVGPNHPVIWELESQLRALNAPFGSGKVVDVTVGPDRTVWALSSGTIRTLPGSSFGLGKNGAGVIGLPIFIEDLGLRGSVTDFAVSDNGRDFYFSDEVFAIKVECFVGSDQGGETPPSPCNASGFLDLTEIELDGELPGAPPVDNDNRIGDVTLTSDETTLYIVGRRTIFTIDTATAKLVARYRMQAGGGALSQIVIPNAVTPCTPQSTSLYGLIREAKAINTSQLSQNKLFFKLKNARKRLLDGDITGARTSLQQVIFRTTARSNLPEGDLDRIPPEDAASMLCGVGNLLERVRLD